MSDSLPKARNENIVVQKLENEVFIYDLKKNQAFCLNNKLSIIWNHCNGVSSFEDVMRDFSINHNLKIDKDYIWFALQKLSEKELLQTDFCAARISRRDVIFKYGLASVTLPVIASLIAPTAVSAQSCANAGGFPSVTPVDATVSSGGTETCQKLLEAQCCSGVVTNYSWNTSPTSQDGSCDAQCK